MTREEYYNLIAYHCYLTHHRVGDAYEGQRADFNKLWERTKQRINKNLPDITITDENKSPWISAEERLPEDGQLILYAIPRKPYWFYDTVYYPEPHITDDIKYWMPIPALPKEDNQ